MKFLPVILFLILAVVVSLQDIPGSFNFSGTSGKIKHPNGQGSYSLQDKTPNKYKSDAYSSSFTNAYYSGSYTELQKYLDNIASSHIKPFDWTTVKEPYLYVKYVYQIFEDFYTPKNLSRIGFSSYRGNFYSDLKYALIQDHIDVKICDSITGNIFEKKYFMNLSIQDFRPNVKIPGTKVIYLDEWLKRGIMNFLDNPFITTGNDTIISIEQAIAEREKKLNFLNKYLMIFRAGMRRYWVIETYPVLDIFFNRDFSKARVDFMLDCEGGEAYYERTGNKWNLVKAGVSWIE